MVDLKNKVFLDTDGEMTFENKERVNFIMYFTRIGANYSTLETANSVFVHEDTETSFKEIWLPCAESKQAEIDSLKAEKHGAEIGHEHFVKQLKERHSQEIEQLKSENAALKEKLTKVAGGEYVVVKKDDIENWYLDEGEYVWYEKDSIDSYLEDIDNGEVLEVQRKEYVVINSNPVFATNVYEDADNIQWELFDSKEDAEKAAAHCKAMIEAAQGDGDE
ncbi:hypothetical protein [Acinetobacter ursingii]|uniref:hypothetical protein n=1 Tax=Acinetobacter ursingii TaxID=108980 RepID=UPI00124D0C23|nr:hypothetical protein [Acinetobacter ursingii]